MIEDVERRVLKLGHFFFHSVVAQRASGKWQMRPFDGKKKENKNGAEDGQKGQSVEELRGAGSMKIV